LARIDAGAGFPARGCSAMDHHLSEPWEKFDFAGLRLNYIQTIGIEFA
jgi:hypothetical protein